MLNWISPYDNLEGYVKLTIDQLTLPMLNIVVYILFHFPFSVTVNCHDNFSSSKR